MTTAARQLSSVPAFSGATVCAGGCGTILSKYNPGELCAVCAAKEPEPAPQPDLDFAVLGILCSAYAEDPEQTVDVLAALRDRGVAADCWTVGHAVRRIRRRFGIVARGVRGRPGYRIVEAEARYKEVRGFGGVPMRRDPDGHFAAVDILSTRSRTQPEVAGSQEPLFAFDEAAPRPAGGRRGLASG